MTRPVGVALACLFALLAIACAGASSAQAAVSCPNPNPVLNENECKTGSSSWQVFDYSKDLGGFTTQTSVDLGEDVVLKIGRNGPVSPQRTVNIDVYRMGYYGGAGARLVKSATNVPINNDYTCKPMDPKTGLVDCGNWNTTYTIAGSSLPATGVYLAKLTASTGDQTHVVFTVRDDDASSKMLFVLPVTNYQAYNLFGGKSLYFGNLAGDTVGTTPATGTDRAAKVSFNRPFSQAGAMQNWFLGPDYDLLYWMEKQGYDVSYSDDVAAHVNPASLLDHDVDVVSGHSEYWSEEQFNGFKAAREAGVNLASFSANTSYWKVRYEDGTRTLVCYKTVQGSGSSGNGTVTENDPGPDGIKGTADDALGLDGEAGTADDNPQNSTTTFRDNGAPKGDPNAPAGGRVGPDMPENELWGVLYMGDDDAFSWPLTVPAGNGLDEFAADRIWRNTGLPENASSNIGTRIVNWEWDAVPTQPQYLAHQPANVVKLSSTVIANGSDQLNWLLDEGRMRSKVAPPPGQPNTVNAVKYKAASGALVFASGTMLWSHGLSNEAQAPIQQATYNIFSDMGVQPVTPEEDLVLDPGGSNQAPNASFTVSPNPVKTSTTVTFNGAASSDPNGTIAKYEWDLDGNGSYETNSGTKASTTRTYSAEGEYQVRLKVTDNGGATDFAVRTLTVINNQPPSAAFTYSPTAPVQGEAVTFNGSGSKDPDGTISKYEWDLDGNGTYETNSGSNPSTSRTYASPGEVNVSLRVTDNGGKQAVKASLVSIASNGISNYSPTVMATPGLAHYWRLNETSGTTFADSVGSSPATIAGAPTLAVNGGVPNDADKAARFKGAPDSAKAQVDLSDTQAITIEFWLKWNAYSFSDDLVMEFTNNFNDIAGGFIVDPDAPQLGGTFGVGIGQGATRNNVFFPRPTAAAWHHYAFAIDTSKPGSEVITPYVDGKAVEYTKLDSGSGGGFANSTLNFMSRATTSLFGEGDLDEVAIFKRALTAEEIDEHFNSDSGNKRPQASFTAPATALANTPVAFDASASKDPDGSIAKYEWDLDGNGSYETNTGTTATVSKTYTANGNVKVGLRVTDDAGSAGVAFRTVAVEGAEEPEEEVKVSNYSPTVLSTPGLLHYWRMNEASGTSFADSVGGVTATAVGGVGMGVAGGIPNDTDKAARFDGANDGAKATLNLSGKTAITVEFWLKWNAYANDDDLAMEFTNNFNENAGGFLIDPNAPQQSGSFGVGIGAGTSRNNAFFARPSAGTWHHYAFVLDTQAPAAEQITPYVDGKAVAYAKLNSGTGAMPFANSSLNMMSRATAGLFGAGDLDEVAIYDRALSAATIDEHFNSESGNKRPLPSFTSAPAAPKVGETVSFDASASKDPDGSITKYEWDLDGNGSYETDTGTTASATQAYSSTGVVKVGLKVTDNGGASSTTTRSVAIEAQPGPEEVAGYAESVLGTAGLIDYWRLGEPSGSVFVDSVGGNHAAVIGDPALGVAGGVPHDSDRAARFDGVNDAASAAVKLGGKTAATVEFWMKADSWTNDDDLALELTNNFNSAPGGFIVDPHSSYNGFAVGIGQGASRNVSVFPRPSAGVWHHYAFVLDTQAPASEQVIPYVDGAPVGYTKVESGTGAPPFADAALNFMSRGGVELFGAGDLDEVALYDRALSASTISNHFQGLVDNKRPLAVLQAPSTAEVGETVNFSATGSSDTDGTIAKHEWDLDGNGSYETDTGATASASHAYANPTTLKIGLRVTDDGGSSAVASRLISIEGEEPAEEEEPEVPAGPSYSEGVQATPGLVNFWRMGESSGSTFADSVGGSTATIAGEPTLGIDSAITGDTDKAASFDGSDDAASAAATGLAGKTAATVEFWMKWDSWANDDDLAMELTNNFNSAPGGFLIDPNSGYGSFAVGIGQGGSRNVALFARPSLGTWHHYAFTLDTQAPAEQQIVPYVDGQPVAFTKALNGTGAPAFADAALNFMSRAASSLNGAGDLDEVALYDRALDAKTVADHFALAAHNSQPEASFTLSPNTTQTGNTVNFDASASTDPGGAIVKYVWDLDGNGTFETNSGSSPTTSRAYATAGARTISLRVVDGSGARATTTRSLTIQNTPPTASFTAAPNPVQTGKTVTYDAASSSDSDGTIAKYEWDLDGNGSYETDTGATASASSSYATIGSRSVGLRVTDNNGGTATSSRNLNVLNSPPSASFTATPNPAPTGTAVAFDGSGSSDSDGSVAKYEWDFDGNGSYEVNAGASAITNKTFAAAGTRTVGLRITDNNGGTATSSLSVEIQNRAPAASFTTTPSTAQSGVAIAFNGAGSTDPDGTIAKYEWDFDNNGSYETDAGATATTNRAFFTPGTLTVGLRVTDNNGASATTTRTVTVTNAPAVASFTATPNPASTGTTVNYDASASKDVDDGITKYEWDLDGNTTYETNTGTTASASSSYATSGTRTIRLRITNGAGATTTTSISVSITNRAPEPSFTATPNPVLSGSNTVLNASGSKDPDGTVAKYEWDLDGNGTFEINSGSTSSTTRSFAASGERTVGLRVTDNQGATATTTRVITVTNRAPTASFTVSPSSVASGTSTTLNASGSSDPDGTIAKYEWDFDNDGTYDATTATSSTTTSYPTQGSRTIGLRVTDNLGATATTTRTVTVTNRAPTAVFTTSPSPAVAGAAITFDAGGSTDLDGTIAKYEWDFDNNGTYEVNGGTNATTTKSFSPAGDRTIRLRVTDNNGATTVDTETLSVRGAYSNAVLSTAGLTNYWRLGESSGSTLNNSAAGSDGSKSGATFGAAGPLSLDPDTALSFDGSNDYATAPLNLSGNSKVTIEFWLRWNSYSNNDDIAFELTSNFNNSNGGFLINPNSSSSGGRFEVALGRNGSRNNAYFTRPSANAWHHYAIVLDTTAAAANQIAVYVDGSPVSIVKGSSGTGAGNFANSTLYMMARNGGSLFSSSLFGAGTLDEVAIYTQALSAAQISQHFTAK
ncbi:MAG TPA: PKD domain-containing protein [Solirubrobacterales bacterium]|nr:PKD domain-containing protein [Solirubrobacterales bacterium]